jgi:hypothetical protein
MNLLHAITLAALLHHTPATPVVTCRTGTVSYRFSGTPGAVFAYGGTRYSVPAAGSIEILADDKTYLAANGRTLPLDVWPIDAFGTRNVPLEATPASAGSGTDSSIR